jgi:hypothetical protein
LENRSGTNALRALEPQGQLADGQLVEVPISLEALKKIGKPNSHQAFEKRRGNDYIDVDEIE